MDLFHSGYLLRGDYMKESRLYVLFILVAAFCWGTSGVFTKKITLYGFTPIEMGFIKTFIATLILIAFFCRKDKGIFKLKNTGDFFDLALISIFGYSLYSIAYIFTANEVGVGIAGAMLYTKTSFVLLFSAIILREKITLIKIFIILLTILGCLSISGVFSTGNFVFTPKGLFWGVTSGIGFSIYDVIGKRSLNKYSSETVTLYTFMIASAFMGVLANPITTVIKVFQTNTLPIMVLYAIVVSVIPYMLYVKGLSKVEVSVAAVISTFELMVASVAGIIFYNEPITFFKVLGITLMISAVCFLNISSSRKVVKSTNIGEINYD